MKSYLPIAFLSIALSSCTWFKKNEPPQDPGTPSGPGVKCSLSISAANVVAPVVQKVLACANKKAIIESLTEAFSGAVCQTVQTGLIASIVCPKAVDYIAERALSKLPETWGCTGGIPVEQLKGKLLTECKQLPF